ncbi:MAG: hypothetical protein A2287_10120 [Candidatus Melainabacteria bacterium RIFOXYA12_FULL_32_12]|nr:MAG: hypothetical protein A2287_10120 [Candidatus Melainabacteria bacterium RIFOXYA12_FULL_32_12]
MQIDQMPQSDHMDHQAPSEMKKMEPIELPKPKQQSPMDLIMLNMRRDGSGTSWQPIDNPMLMKMWQLGRWTTMLHWSVFGDYDNQGGPRGDQGFYSENWGMASVATPIRTRSVTQFRDMMSLEPLTVGSRGYPLLFQTGETFRGEPLIDRQHPHDLFMELSAQYWLRLKNSTWFRLYAAPVGEPALGPVAYPHRYSALLNPEAPLSHHIQDSSHITFGVATAGIASKNLQVEGSIFNGREPDENRYDFDFGPFTSYSGRISYLPNPNTSFQISCGLLDDPESIEPGDVTRLTASTQYIKMLKNGWIASSIVFGHNFEAGPDETGVLWEATWNFRKSYYLFTRIENVYRAELLENVEDSGVDENRKFGVTVFSFGAARDLFRIKDVPFTLGTMMTMYAKSRVLDQFYGDFPISFHVFLHTNAPPMKHMPNINNQMHSR